MDGESHARKNLKPIVRCHKCHGSEFEVVEMDDVKNSHKTIAAVVCSNDECRIIVGLVPYKDMKVDVGILEQ